MKQPTRTTTCLIAHFEGYIDDVCDIQDDPQLEEDIKTWHKNHPEYDVHLIKYNHPGSSNYPMYADVYYTEHGGRWWHYQLEPTIFIGSKLTENGCLGEKVSWISFSNKKLADRPEVAVGQEIDCPHCGDKHILFSSGVLDEFPPLLFYKCGYSTYLGGIGGKLVDLGPIHLISALHALLQGLAEMGFIRKPDRVEIDWY